MHSTLKCPATKCKKNFSFQLDTSIPCVQHMYIKFNDDKYLQTECRTICSYASSLNTGTSSHISLDFLKFYLNLRHHSNSTQWRKLSLNFESETL